MKENYEATLTVKVTNEEKQLIHERSEELGISLSEFIRIMALSSHSKAMEYYSENESLKKQIQEMKVRLSYFSKIDAYPESIVLPVTKDQNSMLKSLMSSCWRIKEKVFERQILEYLINDCLLCHYEVDSDNLRSSLIQKELSLSEVSSIGRDAIKQVFGDYRISSSL